MKLELTFRSENIEDEFKVELALRANDMRLALNKIVERVLETSDIELKEEVNKIVTILDLKHIVEYDYS